VEYARAVREVSSELYLCYESRGRGSEVRGGDEAAATHGRQACTSSTQAVCTCSTAMG
jgi:hypothetical protein